MRADSDAQIVAQGRLVKFELGKGRKVDLDQLVRSRFWAKVRKTEGCWLWTAATNGTQGYGIFRGGTGRDKYGSRSWVLAHRYAYEAEVGPIPEGYELDHLCRTRRCVNSAHLEPVLHRENTLRGTAPPAEQARRDRCIRGHLFDKRQHDGRRRCSICDREKEYRRYVRRHGRAPRPNARTKRRLAATG